MTDLVERLRKRIANLEEELDVERRGYREVARTLTEERYKREKLARQELAKLALDHLRSVRLEEITSDPRGFYVYTLWDADDEPLYVGSSNALLGRLQTHLSSPMYGHLIARWSVQQAESKAEMLQAETKLIETWGPPLNATGVKHRMFKPNMQAYWTPEQWADVHARRQKMWDAEEREREAESLEEAS